MSEERINGFYLKSSLSAEWNPENCQVSEPKEISKGSLQGRKYCVYSKKIHHDDFSWKFTRGLAAFLLTFLTGGLALISKNIRSLWEKSITGDEIKRRKVVDVRRSENIRSNNPVISTGKLGQGIINTSQAVIPSNENQSQNIEKPTVAEPKQNILKAVTPPIETPSPKTVLERNFPPFGGKSDDGEVNFPSILTLKPQNEKLNEEAKIFTKEQDRYGNRMDFFMSQPLNRWHEHDDNEMMNITALDAKDNSALNQRILDRIEQLDAFCDLKKRASALKKGQDIQIQDIEAPWELSALKILFQTDDEIANMAYDSIIKLSPRQTQILMQRVATIDMPKGLVLNLTEENFEEITVAQISQISVEDCNRFILKLDHEKIFPLLTESQYEGLNITALNDDQFKYIYSKEKRIHQLLTPRLEECLERLTQLMPEALSYLSDPQIQSLDFKNEKLVNNKGFWHLCMKPESYRANTQGHGARILNPLQVLDCLNRGLFSKETAKLITWEQIHKIDLTKVDCEKAGVEVITALFSTSEKLQTISNEKSLHHVLPFIDPSSLDNLSKLQIQMIDFSDENLIDKRGFDHLSLKAQYHRHQNRQGDGVRSLRHEQVIDCLNRGLFDKETAAFITEEQIKKIDLTKVNCEKVGVEVITAMFNTSQKLQMISTRVSLRHVLPFINPLSLDNLSKSQIQMIDFSDENLIDKTGFDHLSLKADYYRHQTRQGDGVRSLKPEQVIDCLNRGLFDKETAAFITEEQIKKIDLIKVKCEKAGVEVITAMFNTSQKLQMISNELRFHHVLPFIHPSSLDKLSESQIQMINFRDENLIDKIRFDQLSLKAHYYRQENIQGGGVRSLQSKQVMDCLNRGLFDKAAAEFITVDQIKKIDLTRVDCKKAGGESVITAMFNTSEKLQAVTSEGSLYHILPFINPSSLDNLSESQIQMIDFSDEKLIDKTRFDNLSLKAYYYRQNNRQGDGIRSLKPAQVIDCLSRGLFDNETISFITDDVLRQIDLKEIEGFHPETLINKVIERKKGLK